jgi:hypothetical protein
VVRFSPRQDSARRCANLERRYRRLVERAVRAESAKGAHGEDDDGDDDDDPAPDLWQYFDSSAFTGFDDAEGGFFKVYARVFGEIDGLEEEFEMEDQYHTAAPPFGIAQLSTGR